jgi:hypothetical protein
MWASLVLTFAIVAGGKGGEVTRGLRLRASNEVTDEAPGLFTRVRSTERFMIALIREGYDRSPAFRDLVEVHAASVTSESTWTRTRRTIG